MSEAHCRCVAASAGQAGRRFAGGQLFQLGGQVLIRLVQGGDPVLPRRGLANHRGRAGVQQAAPGGRNAGVDRVPDQRVADRHRAGGFFRPPLHQACGHRRIDRRAGRGHLRRLAQLRQRHAQVQHREHLQDDPGLGRQHGEVLADGGGQRPWQRVAPRRPRLEAGSFAQQRPQVQRVPARAAVQPTRHLIIERFGPERGRQCRHIAHAQAPQRYTQPVLHARQHPLGRFGQAVHAAPVGHHGDHRVHRQPPQHEQGRGAPGGVIIITQQPLWGVEVACKVNIRGPIKDTLLPFRKQLVLRSWGG